MKVIVVGIAGIILLAGCGVMHSGQAPQPEQPKSSKRLKPGTPIKFPRGPTEAQLRELVGLQVAEAESQLKAWGFDRFRVVEQYGTLEYAPGRVNLTLNKDGRVTKANVG